jgi:tetratricopeptide (TPR) repeat protein
MNALGIVVLVIILTLMSRRGRGARRYWELGDQAFKASDWVTAEQHFRRCLKSWPSAVPVLQILAATVAQQGRMKEAEDLFLRAAAFEPRNPQTYLWFAFYYLSPEVNRPDEAYRQFQRAFELNPDLPGQLAEQERFAPLRNNPYFAPLFDSPKNGSAGETS